jgi:phosphoserine phosphatase RsbU/P
MMTKLKLLRLKNAMLFTNIISNAFGILVISMNLRRSEGLIAPDLLGPIHRVSMVFIPLSFLIPTLIALVYEKPIRIYLENLYQNIPNTKTATHFARQRLLNEPFLLIAVAFLTWVIAGCLFAGVLWLWGAGQTAVEESFFQNFFTGIITVTIEFFVLEFVFQRRLVKYFFPKGGLSTTAKTLRIRIRTRLLALMLAINIVPLMAIYADVSKIYTSGTGLHPHLPQLEQAIKFEILIFFAVGLWVVFLVSSNLTRPFQNIIQVLHNIKNGHFSSRVKVTSNDEIGYTGDVINEMSKGLEERDRIRHSLSMAKEIQQNLVPRKNVRLNGLNLAGRSVYCDETGGDYYDFISIDADGRPLTGVAVGDVSGHGISSALLMATVRASLRQRASLPGDAAQIITDVNALLAQDVEYSGDFMTLFYLLIDARKRSLEWVRAGHDPAVLYSPASDSFQELTGSGLALGIQAEWQYESYHMQDLTPGQIILLGTDGIWEAENPDGERIGKDPIYQILREKATASAPDILQAVFDVLKDYQRGVRREDDITAVIVKIES